MRGEFLSRKWPLSPLHVVQYTEYECGARNAGIIPVQKVAALLYVCYNIQNMWRVCARNAGIIPVQEVASRSLLYMWYNIQNMWGLGARNAGIIPV
jgi:hypothetical protein